MSLLTVILVLVVVGVVLYFINRPSTPIDGKIKVIINWVAIILVIVWLFKIFGLFDYIGNVRI